MLKILILLSCTLTLNNFCCSQQIDTANFKHKSQHVHATYQTNLWIDIPIIVGGAITNFIGLRLIDNKSRLDLAAINNLNADDINAFDRSAVRQDPIYAGTADKISDWGMNISFALPALLMFDKTIRNSWKDIFIIYVETGIVTANLFSLGAAQFTQRIRPFVYNPQTPLNKKLGIRTTSSFYSGHTASTAAATFSMAKIYSDHHPDVNKFFLYGAAAIPPAFVGYLRYKAGKHFPTDIITGFAVGAIGGVLGPHFHKKSDNSLSIVPVFAPYSGFALSIKLTPNL